MVEPVVVRDEPSRRLTIRLALDGVVVSEFEQGAGEPGPDPHVHREHSDCFYVLDGTLTLSLLDGDREAGPGTFVLVPPNVAHTYRNSSSRNTRFLNLHVPGMGFDRYVLDTLDGSFDQYPPPEDGGVDPAATIVLHPGDGERIGETVVKAVRPEFSLLVFTVEPGDSIGLHFHKLQSDSFYILEGELEFQVGDRVVVAPAGAFVLAPPNVVHCFRNTGDSLARVLNIHIPGGFVEYRRELAALRAAGTEPDDAFFEGHDIFDV
jgi:quercetin dioxygenase-like cupin family protein